MPIRRRPSSPPPRLITPEDLQNFIVVGGPQVAPDGRAVLLPRRHTDARNQTGGRRSRVRIVDARLTEIPGQVDGFRGSAAWALEGRGLRIACTRRDLRT